MRPKPILFSIATLVCLCAASSAVPAVRIQRRCSDMGKLALKQPVVLKAPFEACFDIAARKGEFVRVHVRQRGADAIIRLYDDSQKLVTDPPVDTLTGSEDEERVLFIAERDESFRLVVSITDRAGSVEVELMEVASPDPAAESLRRDLIEAERDFVLASAALAQGGDSPIAYRAALEHIAHALNKIPELSDPNREALLLRILFEITQKAQLTPSLRNSALPVETYLPFLKRFSQVCEARRDYQCAYGYSVQYAYQMLATYGRDVKGHTQQGLKVIGIVQTELTSIQALLGTHDLKREFPVMLANIYNNLGAYAIETNDLARASRLINEALEIGSGTLEEIISINSIGEIAYLEGRLQDAINSYRQALKLIEAGPFPTDDETRRALKQFRVRITVSLGRGLFAIRDLAQAEKILRDVLPLAAGLQDPSPHGIEANILQALGVMESVQGKVAAAEQDLTRAIALLETNPRAQLGAKVAYARVLIDKGDSQQALKISEDIEQGLIALGNPRALGYSLMNKAEALRRLDRRAEAKAALDKATEVGTDPAGDASIHYLRGRILFDESNFAGAFDEFRASATTIEFVRDHIARVEQKEVYFDAAQQYYDWAISSAARLAPSDKRFSDLALEMLERARARALLDAMAIAQVRPTQTNNADAVKISGMEAALALKLRQLATTNDTNVHKRLQSEVDSISENIANVTTDMLNRYPEIKALRQPLTPVEIQSRLPEDAVLLAYRLMEEQSVLIVVTHGAIRVVPGLPGAKTIDGLADSFYKVVSHSESTLDDYIATSRELAEVVLGRAPEALRAKRLFIIPDGHLAVVPFAALPIPGSSALSPLITQIEVVTLPSASVLGKSEKAPRKKRMVIFGDPVFDWTDAVLRSQELRPSDKKPQMAAGAKLTQLQESGYPRLPATKAEAEAICTLFGDSCGRPLLNFEASKANAVAKELSDAGYLHFATHTDLTSSNPGEFAIVLSFYNRDLKRVDGLLRLHDIFSLRLSAELVTLSACETAFGPSGRSEGINSISRGFLFAGAKNVLATLWKADSDAASEFMRVFYIALAEEHLSPSEALQKTQQLFAGQDFLLQDGTHRPRKWQHPYFWAAFALYGTRR
jgi:CHAT domain-containing protein